MQGRRIDRWWTPPVQEWEILPDCEYAKTPASTADTLTYYDSMRKYVEHEDGLINSRLTWSLTIHGFLFTAFSILTAKIADLLTDPKTAAAPRLVLLLAVFLIALELVIALLGAFVGYSSRQAIVGAHNAIQNLDAIVHAEPDSVLFIQPRKPAPPAPAVAPERAARSQILLPRIIRGGAAGSYTAGARSYYLKLPLCMMVVWALIALAVSGVLWVRVVRLWAAWH